MPTPTPTPAPTLTPKPSATPKPAGTDSDGITFYRGFADPRTITPQPVADPASLTALVNKYYALPPDYVPPLVAVAETAFALHPAAHEAWTAMKEDLRQTIGVEIIMLSAYRSYSAQAASFRNALERKGVAGTVPYNALEGRSEHQLGLAVDVNDDQCEPHRLKFANTPTYAWLSAHAHEYGFILRYPAGKEAITGYANEPWHYRFVGTEAAGIIHANNWTLEEYLGLAG